MARSAEKAMTALARWRAAYVEHVQEIKKRPVIASECTQLKDALYFRRQIVHDISRKIAQIQNPSLGEYTLRDLNDEINKLVREKSHWEDHIKTLGGPDFKAEAPKMLEKEGKEVPGNRGYRYYGASRDLPGVRELFEEEPQQIYRKSRGELMKMIDVSYYGNCDEDDGVIVPQEAVYEQEAIARKVAEWKVRQADPNWKNISTRPPVDIEDQDEVDEDNTDTRDIYSATNNPADDEIMRLYEAIEADDQVTSDAVPSEQQLAALGGDDEDEEDDYLSAALNQRVSTKAMSSLGSLKRAFVAHVPVYTQEQIGATLLEKRKREILEKYMSDDLVTSLATTGEILGIDTADESENNQLKASDVHQDDIEEDEEEDDAT